MVMFHIKLVFFWNEYFMSREKSSLKYTVNMFWKMRRKVNASDCKVFFAAKRVLL